MNTLNSNIFSEAYWNLEDGDRARGNHLILVELGKGNEKYLPLNYEPGREYCRK